MDNNFLKKYKRCLYEYTNAAGSFDISEEGDEMEMPQGGAPEGGMDQGMGQDMGAMPGAEGGAPEGGMDPGMGQEMGGMPMGDTMQPDDEVIDVDDLTQSQESAEKKIDAMNAKFEKLMGAVEVLVKQNAQRDREAAEAEKRAAEQQARLESELEKRIPTPQQRMTMRSTKSAPYAMTPNEYMNNYAPENYSDEDDNNGADDMQYQITKDDIDRFTDYNSIAKELDVDHQGLHDILGF